MECEPPPEEGEGKPPPKGEGGGEPLLKQEVVGRQPQPRGQEEERRSEPPSHGEVEGIDFNVIAFKFKRKTF